MRVVIDEEACGHDDRATEDADRAWVIPFSRPVGPRQSKKDYLDDCARAYARIRRAGAR